MTNETTQKGAASAAGRVLRSRRMIQTRITILRDALNDLEAFIVPYLNDVDSVAGSALTQADDKQSPDERG